MNLILSRLKKVFPAINKEAVTETEFWRVIKSEGVYVHFWHLPRRVNGFYGVNSAVHYIVINAKLLPNKWLLTALHELNHRLLNVPRTELEVHFSWNGKQSRQDREAEDAAIIQLIPQPLFFELCRSDEIEPQMLKILPRRKYIFETYGV